ncbi:MAG TPA: hypothetical protein VGM54_10030 [Chthoniobacter sp.]|jgi:hypothetical protein
MAKTPIFSPKNQKPGENQVTAVSVLVRMSDGRFRYVKLGSEQTTKLFGFMVRDVCRGKLELSKPLTPSDTLQTVQRPGRFILPR